MPAVIELDATIVAVTGGRDYANKDLVYETLDTYFPPDERPASLIHGDCTGADALADAWARERGVPVLPLGAPWHVMSVGITALAERFNATLPQKFVEAFKAWAGPLRNDMVVKMLLRSNARRKVLIAFSGNRGTADCVRRAKAVSDKIAVLEIREP